MATLQLVVDADLGSHGVGGAAPDVEARLVVGTLDLGAARSCEGHRPAVSLSPTTGPHTTHLGQSNCLIFWKPVQPPML